MTCSKSCAPKYRAEMVEPCVACQQLVNGDYKCMICNQNIHLPCAAPQTDEGTDVVCPNCNFINEDLSSKVDETVEGEEDYVPPSDGEEDHVPPSDGEEDHVPPSDGVPSDASISTHTTADAADKDNNLCK